MSSREEAMGLAEDQVERPHLHTGLGVPQDPSVRVGCCGQEKGSLGLFAGAATSVTQPQISG